MIEDPDDEPVIRGQLYRITPIETHPRASEPPDHDGPDPSHMAVLDGATAKRIADHRRRAAREALQQRPHSSIGPVYTLADTDRTD